MKWTKTAARWGKSARKIAGKVKQRAGDLTDGSKRCQQKCASKARAGMGDDGRHICTGCRHTIGLTAKQRADTEKALRLEASRKARKELGERRAAERALAAGQRKCDQEAAREVKAVEREQVRVATAAQREKTKAERPAPTRPANRRAPKVREADRTLADPTRPPIDLDQARDDDWVRELG